LIVKNIGVGRFVFRLQTAIFKMNNLRGHFAQRAIENPWILRKLGPGKGRLLLDVGCSGSLLDHELLARGFRVVGLDIQDHTMRNYRQVFIKEDVVNTRLPSESFDVITLVSVIEHVGLDAYDQTYFAADAPFKAMLNLRRLLKPDGILLLTTPYEGKGPLQIYRFMKNFLERRHDKKMFNKLLSGFKIVNCSFFLCRLGKPTTFSRVEKSLLDKLSSDECEGSLACVILKKSPLV
jgi:2-polyprenyl-3-methyl-5-hydroxy-6-metoxy-1,4-benzoquinol methylase